jgi:SulP family sulfate permease
MPRIPWAKETLAGLAGAIGSVPDGMATAVLAGANPMAGLYASFAGPIAGGLLQSTTVMVIATTSAAAVTTSEVMNAGPADPLRTLATLTVLAGLLMVLATRLGFARLMRFVSASVMAGFMFGVGLILILGQLADATGVKTSGDNTLEKALNTLRQWQSFSVPSILTAATAIGVSVLLGKGKLAALAPLIGIMIPSIVITLTDADVATVASTSGPVAVGLPPLTLPDLGLVSPNLVAAALALTIVVLVQAAGVGVAYPNTDGSNDVGRDFYAQGGANVASGLFGGIPVGGSVGQTAFNVMAGGRTRWAVIISGLWMLVFVVALGPLLSDVPMPALAGLLILAGFGALKPRDLARSWRTSWASGAAAIITMVATLLVQIHIAVLIGVILSLLLVGITSASSARVVALERVGQGWRRVEVPSALAHGAITVLDVEGSGTFASVPALVGQLPQPPATAPGTPTSGQPSAVVLRVHGPAKTNLTFTKALEDYAQGIEGSGGRLIVCGLQPATITQLRSAGLPDSVALVPQGEDLNASLTAAYEIADGWLAGGPAR